MVPHCQMGAFCFPGQGRATQDDMLGSTASKASGRATALGGLDGGHGVLSAQEDDRVALWKGPGDLQLLS